ncbi:MAG TPA: hypothetical protein VLM11_22445 [Streptosporangiaceae bacterium]|nr:hypothetical protein [Streptosporangiaceae bacterium]
MVEPHLRRGHQRRRDRGQPGMAGEIFDLRDLLPPAEVLSEHARIVGAARHLRERAWAGEHGVDRAGGRG